MDGIESIDREMFKNLLIKEIIWPSTCKSIPIDCFAYSKIENIYNIDKVSSIGAGAFSFCTNLKYFKYPQNCKTIPVHAFSYSGLEKIDMSNANISEIDCYAFKECIMLKNLILPQIITSIKPHAFESITQLEELIWPEKCLSIPSYCFAFSKIKFLQINTDNISISPTAFSNAQIDEIRIDSKKVVLMDRCFQGAKIKKCYISSNNCVIEKSIDLDNSEIDLQKVGLLEISNSTLNSNKDKIKLPYYVISLAEK